MREPPAPRAVIDAAVFDAALTRVVERAVGTAAADNTGARVIARLAVRRWYPTAPQLLAVPAAVALVMVTLWHEPRSVTPTAVPSAVSAVRTASSTPAADDGAHGTAADAAAPDHRGAEPRAAIGAAPVAIGASARRRGRTRPGPATVDDLDGAVPALPVTDSAADTMAELSEPTSSPVPLPVDRLELAPIVAAALDPGRDH
jgi:hypothetical protein